MPSSLTARALIVVLLVAGSAYGDDAACVDAHAKAQQQRKQGKLREARASLGNCAARDCPALIRKDCAGWLEDVEGEIPSVVVSAKNANGEDVSNVRVLVDGDPVAEELDGKPIELDPGSYTFRFEHKGGQSTTVEVVAKTGVQNQPVRVRFGSPRAASRAEEEPSSTRPLAYAFAGVGVIALGSFGYFAIHGQRHYDELQSGCGQQSACSTDDSDSVHRDFVIADVSLAVAAVALGAGAYFYFSSPEAQRESTDRRLRVGVHPLANGALLGLEGATF